MNDKTDMQTARSVYRIGAAGLDPRDWRLIEIVFKHSQYNRYEFVLSEGTDPNGIDILIANTNDAQGVRAVSAVRNGGRLVPVIAAVPRGSPGAARHAISIDRLTLQLLPILNRVVELELLPKSAPASTASLAPATAAAHSNSNATLNATAGVNAAATGGGIAVAGVSAGAAQGAVKPSAGLATNLHSTALPDMRLAAVPTVSGSAPSLQPTASLSVAPSSRDPSLGPSLGPITSAPAIPFAVPPAVPSPPASAGLTSGAGPRPASVVAAPAESVAARPFTLSPPAPTPLRALVVDDSPTVRQQLLIALGRMGLQTDAVDHAASALEALASQYYDIVLADVVMPDMDGYKLTRTIKRNKQYRQIPVVLLTSRSSPFDLARGALAGCDSYLTKPVTLQALEKTILKQLRKSLAIDDLSGMLRPPSPAAVEPALTAQSYPRPADRPATAAASAPVPMGLDRHG